jgi:hypothetical protein
MPCGDSNLIQQPSNAADTRVPRTLPPLARASTVRIPYGNRGSDLMTRSAPLTKPGYTGIKFPFTLKRPGSRVLATYNPDTIQPGKQEIRPLVPANGVRTTLSYPGLLPSSTQPDRDRTLDRGAYFYQRFPMRPGVGDALPVQGHPRYVAPGFVGGINYGMRFAYTGVDLPMDLVAKQRRKLFELEVRKARLAVKPAVRLKPGLSGREAATAYRGKPGTPSGVVGAGPVQWGRPTTIRGTMNLAYYAPPDVLAQMARDAVGANP